jgi:hypothetical protein
MTASLPNPLALDLPPDDLPRFLRAFWRLVRWALPDRFRFFGLYEYRIAQAFDGPVLNLQATPDTLAVGLLDTLKVSAWPGLAGAKVTPTAGSRVLVQFINGNQARAVVVAWAPQGDPGWLPAALALDAIGAITIGGMAAAVNVGGAGAQPLALASPLSTWAGSVVTAFAGLSVTVPPLASVATTKAKGL